MIMEEDDHYPPLPGFRFYPTEEELISFYLHHKLNATPGLDTTAVIPVLQDIFQTDPWHLPNLSGEQCRQEIGQWFFFSPMQEREAAGSRPCRVTATGYWKATGSPGYVYSMENKIIGLKKSMVFYMGKTPVGQKTKWKMNEYKAIFQEPSSSPTGVSIPELRHEMSVCRVYTTTGSERAFDRRPLASTSMAMEEEEALFEDPVFST